MACVGNNLVAKSGKNVDIAEMTLFDDSQNPLQSLIPECKVHLQLDSPLFPKLNTKLRKERTRRNTHI